LIGEENRQGRSSLQGQSQSQVHLPLGVVSPNRFSQRDELTMMNSQTIMLGQDVRTPALRASGPANSSGPSRDSILLPLSQITSHFYIFRESNHLKFNQYYRKNYKDL
jgi:hypothetical protein